MAEVGVAIQVGKSKGIKIAEITPFFYKVIGVWISLACWHSEALYSNYVNMVITYLYDFLTIIQPKHVAAIQTHRQHFKIMIHTHAHTQRGISPPACFSMESRSCFWWDNLCVVLRPMWGRDYIFIWGVFILPLPSVTSSVAMGYLQELYSGVLG